MVATSFVMIFALLYLAFIAFYIYCGWKLYEKAGKPGWASLVPIYNIVILMDIIRKPRWWVLLMLVPVVNIVILILTYLELAKAFGKSTGFAVGLFFFAFIFFPMLALGDAEYVYGESSDNNINKMLNEIGQ